MNRNDFIKLIESGGPDNRNILGELSSLINVFPYFQSAYMLLLKGMHNTSDVKFENQLRSSAIRIANREVLYYYLSRDITRLNDKVADEPEKKDTENDRTDTQQVVIELAKNSDDLISEIERDQFSQKSDHPGVKYSIIITSDSGDTESDASLIVVNEESGDIEEKVVYMDPGFSAPENDDLLELDIDTGKISESDEEAVRSEKESEQQPLSVKEMQSDLIDRFIIANPRIEPVREIDELSLSDISLPFTEAKEEFLSETLARIYIKQGYYSKAINIYEKLSLKYPEKSSYFAVLISEVQELIKK